MTGRVWYYYVDSLANAAFNLASGSKQEVPFMDSFVFFEMRIKVLFVASALPLALGLVRGNKTIDDVLSYISTILHYLLNFYFLLLLLDHQRTLHFQRAKERKAGSKMNKIQDRLIHIIIEQSASSSMVVRTVLSFLIILLSICN